MMKHMRLAVVLSILLCSMMGGFFSSQALAIDYQPTENSVQNTGIPALTQTPVITRVDIWQQGKVYIIIGLLLVSVIFILLWLLAYRNHQLKESKDLIFDTLSAQEAILSAIPELMFELDMNGRYLNIWTRDTNELTTSKSELIGKTVVEMLPPEAAHQVMQALNQAELNDKSQGQEIQLTTPAGIKWFELSTSIKSREVEPHLFVMLSRDITSRKQSEERYRGLFENMADGVVIYKAVQNGHDFEFIEFNRSAERIEGIRRENLMGRKLTEVFPGVKEMGLFEVLQRVWSTGIAESFPLSFYADERLTGWRDNFVYQLESGELVAIYSDETARKIAEYKLHESESLKQLILHSVPDMMWLKDVNGIYQSCNWAFERFVDAKEIEIIGKTDFDLFDEEFARSVREQDRNAINSASSLVTEEWVVFADDAQKVLLETIKTVLKNEQGETIGVLGIGHDITERFEVNETRRLSASVFKHTHEGILITNVNSIIIDANPACYELTGYTPEELIGKDPKMLSSGNQPEEFYQQMWSVLKNTGNWQGEVQNRKKTGEIYTERLTIDQVKDEKGRLTHYVGVFSDISYLKEQEIELERIAYTDALTGLPNRLLLHDRMQQAISQAERHKKLVAVCYLDLDAFKPVNDNHGHRAGDEVLIEVGKRLQKVIRIEDSVARLGGDEFVLLMLNLHTVHELEQMVERILETVVRPYILLNGQQVSVSASIGIALYPMDQSDPDNLLRHADIAMYAAKKQGKNRFSLFDASEKA